MAHLRPGHKDMVASAWLSLGACALGDLLPCCEDTQVALWEGSRGEELRPPAHSQCHLASYATEPPWRQILPPQANLQMTAAQADSSTAPSWKTLSQNLPAKLLLESRLSETVDNKC